MEPIANAPSPSTSTPPPCLHHPARRQDLFCVTCKVGICPDCLVDSPVHRRHTIDSLRDVQDESAQRLKHVAGTFRALASANAENSRMLASVRTFELDFLGQMGQLALKAQEYMNDVHRKVALQEDGWRSYLEQQAGAMLPAVVRKNEDCKEKPRTIVPAIEMRKCVVDLSNTSSELCNVVLNYECGFSWNLQFNPKDTACEVTISCRTSEDCPEFDGNFRLLLDVIHADGTATYPFRRSLEKITMSRFFVVPTPIMLVTTELLNMGFIAKNGKMTLNVGIGPEDAQTERNCLMTGQTILQKRIDSLQLQLNRSIFTIGTLTVPNYFVESDGQFHSKPIASANGTRWMLRLKLNQGMTNKNRTYLSVQIVSTGKNANPHEYFVELAQGTRAGFSHRLVGSGLLETVEEPRFIEKSRLDEYLAGGVQLRLRFGVREARQD